MPDEKQTRAFRTILVVDDDERLLRAYSRTHPQAVTFFTAQDSATALALAGEHHPELVIVDLQLGKESGITLVRELRTSLPDACIVLVSGYGSIDTTVSAMRAGADDVVEKPVTLREIIFRVERELNDPTTFEPATLERAQWEHIQRVLGDTNGNISMAARKLGVYRTTLRRWLRKSAPKY